MQGSVFATLSLKINLGPLWRKQATLGVHITIQKLAARPEVCNEENYEGQKIFIKEQVLPMMTIMPSMEDQSPRKPSCTHLCGSSENNGVMHHLGYLKGLLFLQCYQCLIVTWRSFQSCSLRSIYLKMVIANYHKAQAKNCEKNVKKNFPQKALKPD